METDYFLAADKRFSVGDVVRVSVALPSQQSTMCP